MLTCKNCGKEILNTEEKCPHCGKIVKEEITLKNDSINEDDVKKNKFIALLSYLSILILIPLFVAPNSKFVRFHVIQGINLMILDVVYVIVSCLLSLTISPNYVFGVSTTPIPIFILIFNSILGIFITVLSIIGIINAITGKTKELPIIGKIKWIKY